MNGREYSAIAATPAREIVYVRVYRDADRGLWGAYVAWDDKTGPVGWGITGEKAVQRAVAEYYMDSIQVRLPLFGKAE
jgi:hypothetical protein